jgi:hypothetical protein
VPARERRDVDVEQLVAVQGQHRAALATLRRGKSQATPAAERLRLLDRHDLRSEPPESVFEDRPLS